MVRGGLFPPRIALLLQPLVYSMTYSEKLKDPRWQKKRLEIMHAADFQCEECGSKEKTLHIHHRRYIKGREPWDYEDCDLLCLCEDCHSEATYFDQSLFELISYLDTKTKHKIWGYACGVSLQNCGGGVTVTNSDQAEGLGAVFNLPAEKIIALLKEEKVTLECLRVAQLLAQKKD
jgi:hypothetical protein